MLVVVTALLLFSVAVNDLADEAIDRVNKDFRDVRGDALFGKRTVLVRYGRRATCAFSAVCWVAGGALIALAESEMTVVTALGAAGALVLLTKLATDGGHRRDERLVSRSRSSAAACWSSCWCS